MKSKPSLRLNIVRSKSLISSIFCLGKYPNYSDLSCESNVRLGMLIEHHRIASAGTVISNIIHIGKHLKVTENRTCYRISNT